MRETNFEHKFRVGQEIRYPEDNRLKKGQVEEVIFHKKEIRGTGEVTYSVVPQGKSARQAVIRSEEDLIDR